MDIYTAIWSAASFLAGIAITRGVDFWLAKKQELRSDEREKHLKRQASNSEFLKSLVLAMDDPTLKNVRAAREQFVEVEVFSSKNVVMLGNCLLDSLEANSKGVVSSTDSTQAVLRQGLLELLRADAENREPNLQSFQEEMLKDPFLAMLAGKELPLQPSGTTQVLLDIKKKPHADNS